MGQTQTSRRKPSYNQKQAFPRNSQRASTKDRYRRIREDVERIQERVRAKQIRSDEYNGLQRSLVNHSQNLTDLQKKLGVENVNKLQKLITTVTKDLLLLQNEQKIDKLDAGSVETNSFIHVPPKTQPKFDKSTLEDIERKLDSLKGEIKVAADNKDKNRLHFLAKSVNTLMADIQMIELNTNSIRMETKAALEKKLIRTYHNIEKIKERIDKEGNVEQLEKIDYIIEDLEAMERDISAMHVINSNIEESKEKLHKYKHKIAAIPEANKEVRNKKSEIFDMILVLEENIAQVEYEIKLQQVEEAHDKFKMEVDKFAQSTDSEAYVKYKKYFQDLMDYINKIPDQSETIAEQKEQIRNNIKQSLQLLKQKASEYEQKNQNQEETVVIRRNENLTKITQQLQASCEQLHALPLKNYNFNDLKNTQDILNTITQQIMDKTREISQIINRQSGDLQIVNAKINNLPTVESVGKPVDQTPNKMELIADIEKEVKQLHGQIEKYCFNKNDSDYKTIKMNLESYQKKVRRFSFYGSENARTYGLKVQKFIADVLELLESKTRQQNPRSTTEELLEDIMSTRSRVDALGQRIEHSTTITEDEYDSIKTKLLEHQAYLKELSATFNRNINKSKGDALQEIVRHLAALETLNSGSKYHTLSAREKKFNEEVRDLRDKVLRFTGTYGNVLYKKLEEDLHKAASNIDKMVQDANVATKMKMDIESSLLILEQKSTKTTNEPKQHQNEMERIEMELRQIGGQVEGFIGSETSQKFFQLDEFLIQSTLRLDSFKFETKDPLYKRKVNLMRQIQRYTDILDERARLTDKLEELEKGVREMIIKIDLFNGDLQDEQYRILNEQLINLAIELNTVNSTDERFLERKTTALREIEKCKAKLNAITNQDDYSREGTLV